MYIKNGMIIAIVYKNKCYIDIAVNSRFGYDKCFSIASDNPKINWYRDRKNSWCLDNNKVTIICGA